MERVYGTLRSSVDDFHSRESFDTAVRGLEMRSSPGYPYCNEASTIGDWLQFDGVQCDPCRLDMLWSDVCRVMLGEFDSIWRAFVKDEPHKESKVSEGRWRLIIMAPLAVQVAWRMLFSKQNNAEVEQAFSLPSQQGIIMPHGGWSQYLRQWKSQGLDYAADKSAWDWSFPGWALEDDLELRGRLVYGKDAGVWRTVARFLYEDAFRDTKIVFSDGSLFVQSAGWGVMKSGCYNTISTNSHGQLFIHYFYCLLTGERVEPLPAVCGDDTLCAEKHTRASVYARMGVVVKHCVRSYEFVGFNFDGSGPTPVYWRKHRYKFPYVRDEHLVEFLDSMMMIYAHSDDRALWRGLASRLGVEGELCSDGYYRGWFDLEAF